MHWLGDITTDLQLKLQLDRVREVGVCQHVAGSVVHRLVPHVATGWKKHNKDYYTARSRGDTHLYTNGNYLDTAWK